MKLPPPYAHFNEYFLPTGINGGRQLDLHGYTKRPQHFWVASWLCAIMAIYVLLVCYGLLPDGPRVVPSEAESKPKQN